ncbi:Uncharacterised protein [Campylobacter geochelonis]|uniref:Uncharacterized protein n=1 Tax=Campylobacter geochelonis TaxID=1780362 RepID=A0A128EBA9_9BACT|nr:hypothetical protein CGEO_0130 [Campylobacter geochelonis]CZE46219.1 Uncharacterised protein [Campylobacter geochelonis]
MLSYINLDSFELKITQSQEKITKLYYQIILNIKQPQTTISSKQNSHQIKLRLKLIKNFKNDNFAPTKQATFYKLIKNCPINKNFKYLVTKTYAIKFLKLPSRFKIKNLED